MKTLSPFVIGSLLALVIALFAAGCGGDNADVVTVEPTSGTIESPATEAVQQAPPADTTVSVPEPESEPDATDAEPAGFFEVAEARELPARAGGWGYVHAPPFGAIEPEELPELDPFWVACRDGDGGACEDLYHLAWDEITFDSSEAAWEAYFNFAATCGGRRVDRTEPCTELLPGTRTTDLESADRVEWKPEATSFWLSSPLAGQSFDLRNIASASTPPPRLDPELDVLWADCGAGDGAICDQLFDAGDSFFVPEGVYSLFGATCGGRTSLLDECQSVLAPADQQVAQGSSPPGLNPVLDELFATCGAGNASACWELSKRTQLGSSYTAEEFENNWPYYSYARTCGGQLDRPLLLPGCFDYQAWPAIDDVTSLPVPPDY